MSRFNHFLIMLFLAAFCDGACAGIARAAGTAYPDGLSARGAIVKGIYPGTDAGNCCWMSESAQLRLAVPRGADTLLLNVYVPQFAAPRAGQSLRVRVDTAPPQLRCCFGPGEHELLFSLPRPVRSNTVSIELRAGSTFVPKAIGLNNDPRHLSILLRGVSFMNSATGERFDTGPLPWLAPRVALALLVAAGVLILLLTLRRPVFGVAALIATDPFLFAYNIHGTSITLPKVALIAVALGLLAHVRRLQQERSWAAASVLLAAQLLFVATMIAASTHAAVHADALRETLKAVQYAAVLLVAYGAYRLDPDEDAVRLSLAPLTLLVSLLAFAQVFWAPAQMEVSAGLHLPRLAGPLEGPNQFAGFLGVMVPAMLAFAVFRRALAIERIAIAVGVIACILTFSRSGIAAMLLACAVLLAVRYQVRWRTVVGAGVLAAFITILAMAFAVFAGSAHGRLAAVFGSAAAFNGGLGSRTGLWHAAYAMWRSSPLLGIGPGNFEIAVGRYEPGVRTHANGMYFQVLAEQGIAGLLAMLAVVAASVLVFVRRLNQPLALAACMAALAMAFHQIVDCMWVYPKVGVMWWVLLAIAAAAVDLAAVPEHLAEPAVA
jgi:O-antigen ligase